QQGGKARLDAQCLTLRAPLAWDVIIPLAQLLADRLLFAVHARRQQAAGRAQGTRARQHHPETPQCQHGGLGLAQLGQMCFDSREPLVETGLAKHGFPPRGCGFCNFPQLAARREAMSLLKKPPLVSPGTPAPAQPGLERRLALGVALAATKGTSAPEVGQTYARARVLC